jgi:hypothetical protein
LEGEQCEKKKVPLRTKNDGRERKIIKERERKGVPRKKYVEKMKYETERLEERDQKVSGEK